MTAASESVPRGAYAFVDFRHLWWVAAALGLMFAAMASGSLWFLNFVHVMSGLLWTGIDLFMGFVIGPLQRTLDFEARRSFATKLMPKMLFLMPTLATITSWAGTTLAGRLGFFDLGYPDKFWVIGALTVVAILAIQGFLILLPTSLGVCIELGKDEPDLAKIGRRMRTYVRVTGIQGLMQVAIIIIMAKFATGI